MAILGSYYALCGAFDYCTVFKGVWGKLGSPHVRCVVLDRVVARDLTPLLTMVQGEGDLG
jgi:hypothetical protein